jgi:hypothetical protein
MGYPISGSDSMQHGISAYLHMIYQYIQDFPGRQDYRCWYALGQGTDQYILVCMAQRYVPGIYFFTQECTWYMLFFKSLKYVPGSTYWYILRLEDSELQVENLKVCSRRHCRVHT